MHYRLTKSEEADKKTLGSPGWKKQDRGGDTDTEDTEYRLSDGIQSQQEVF